MTRAVEVVCAGAVLWDVIGASAVSVPPGSDVPGRVARRPGGVALNVAAALTRHGLAPALLAAVGRDPEGDELVRACEGLGIVTDHIRRAEGLPTDSYVAVEGPDGLVAAVADARTLEASGDEILRPLTDGPLGSEDEPFEGTVALDGNLAPEAIEQFVRGPALSRADLRAVPASPEKAERLLPLLEHPRLTLYANLEEAGKICGMGLSGSEAAAEALVGLGARRALVTAGRGPAAAASATGALAKAVPAVPARGVTGAGDALMAAHIAAEAGGAGWEEAFDLALQAAAKHVAGVGQP